MQLIYSFTVALLLTITLIPIMIRFSAQLQLLDRPGDTRKVHDRIVPRSGGLAIVLGAFLPLIFLLPIKNEFIGLFWGGLVIALFGYLDDRFDLNYKWKFIGQIIAVLTVMAGGVVMHRVAFFGLDIAPVYLSYPLTFFFLLAATNAVNLSDGLDGLAAGISLFSLALIAVFSIRIENDAIALFALAMVGGLLGFLRFNTYPARIFMGDTGSQFLGFTIASLAILVSQNEYSAMSPVIPLLILGLPILDTITVIIIRIKEKRSPFSADKKHLHHQLMSQGLKHYQAVAAIYLIQAVLIISTYIFCFESDFFLVSFYILFCLSVISLLYLWSKHRQLHSANPPTEHLIDRRNHLLRKFPWVYGYSATIIKMILIVLLLSCAFVIDTQHVEYTYSTLGLSLVMLLLTVFFKKHAIFAARCCCYTASVYLIYLLTLSPLLSYQAYLINGLLLTLVAFLMLAIRMTRREDFHLDTQDLLVLLIVVVVPQLPFETLDNHSVSEISLRLAALMYACEFALSKSKGRCMLINYGSILSLFTVGMLSLVKQ